MANTYNNIIKGCSISFYPEPKRDNILTFKVINREGRIFYDHVQCGGPNGVDFQMKDITIGELVQKATVMTKIS